MAVYQRNGTSQEGYRSVLVVAAMKDFPMMPCMGGLGSGKEQRWPQHQNAVSCEELQ
jgi:hypothetical protein